jgi:hypothetical protein
MKNSYEYSFEIDKTNETYLKDIDLASDDDKTLAHKVALRLQEGKTGHDERCKKSSDNMALFDGDIEKVMKGGEIAKYNSKALKNVIFLTIRNLVGLSTDNPPIPDVSPAKETPQSHKKAQVIASSLEYDMVRTKFYDLLALCLFDTWVKSDSYLHWFWNYKTNDNDVIAVKMEELTFAPGSTSIQDSEYMVYHPWKNRTWWKKNYPEQYDLIKFETVTDGKVDEASGNRGSSARFIAYWENDIRIEQVMGQNGEWVVLKKGKNPYYEYRSSDDQIMMWVGEMFPHIANFATEIGVTDAESVTRMISDPEVNPEAEVGQMEEFTPILNYLSEPRKPFVQIPSIKLMGDLYSKDIISQIREIFLDMNMKKRQIADNLRGCNTKLVVDSGSFTEEEIESITDEPLQVLRADFQNNPKPVYWAETTNFDINMILTDMMDDARYIDDVFGHHEISRGSGNAGTMGQDMMNLESDKTPIRFQVRAVENAIVELWQGWIQLKKMFYTDTHYIKKMGATDGMEVLELMSKDIEEGIEPILRPMSTAPMSKAVKSQQAMALYEAGALDPYTLYQDLGRNDPQGMVNRLINWVKFQVISAEDPEKLMADMQSQTGTPGDTTENPIEQADQENRAMQNGEDIPPTQPQLVTKDHVKLHIAFINDKKNKMEQDAYDNLMNHIEADKATLVELVKSGMLDEAGRQASEQVNPQQQEEETEEEE